MTSTGDCSYSFVYSWWVLLTPEAYRMKNKRPTLCHLLFYFTSYVLNMFRTLIYPSSGACDYSVELPHWLYCSWFDVCWSFGVVGLEWYPCCRLKPATRTLHKPSSFPQVSLPKFCMNLLCLSYACHIPRLSKSPWFGHPDKIFMRIANREWRNNVM